MRKIIKHCTKHVNRKIAIKYFNYSIILLAILYTIYLLYLPLTILGLTIYGKLSKSNKVELLLGEYYHSLSFEIHKKAYKHFQQALNRHKLMLTKRNLSASERYALEYIIGNSYECGKGTPINLEVAKFWYNKAAKHGIKDAITGLERIKQQETCKQLPK